MSFTIAQLYREPAEGKPDEENERIFEHNKIVSSFESDLGQQQARAAHEFWSAKFDQEHTGHAHRMREVAGGLAGLLEPWMRDVGYLTAADRAELLAFAKDERQDLKQAQNPELEALMKDLDARHAKEALALTAKHEYQPGSMENLQRHAQERQEQNRKFAEERERYASEYQEARRLQDDLRDREKQEELERGQALEDDRGFTR
jgi:hypothetical protein